MRSRLHIPVSIISGLVLALSFAGTVPFARLPAQVPAGTPAAKEQPLPRVECPNCKSTGTRQCRHHRKGLEREADVLFCSVLADCGTCHGALALDCPRCKNPGVEAALAARLAAVGAWRQGRRDAVEKFTKTAGPAASAASGLLHAKTKHFELSFSIKPLKVDKLRHKPDTHELMHIYLDRFEKLYADFCEVFGYEEKDFVVPVELYMFHDQADHLEICPRKTGMGAGGGSGRKYMGDKMVFSMWMMPSELRDDDDLNRYMVHHVTHLLLNHARPHTWIYNKGHGWIDGGIAHWFEMRHGGLCTNFCYEELPLDPGQGYKGGHWRVAVRQLVDSGDPAPFSEVYSVNVDQLGLEEHALSFSYVDFLITVHGGPKLRELVTLIKDKVETRDALQKVYGLTPLSFEDKWRSWVKKAYPKR
jgi:hypothetical protein